MYIGGATGKETLQECRHRPVMHMKATNEHTLPTNCMIILIPNYMSVFDLMSPCLNFVALGSHFGQFSIN